MRCIIPTLFFLLFSISHSVLADNDAKAFVFRKFPGLQPYYRFLYNLLSVLFFVLWLFFIPQKSVLLYKIEFPYIWFGFAVQLIAVFGFIVSSMEFHLGSFIGTEQIKQYKINRTKPQYFDEPNRGKLHTSGFRKYVRHPIYSFAILFLIANPVMYLTSAYISGCLILYFWIGSIFEERKLIVRFGKEYKIYQSSTGRLLPKLYRKSTYG